MRETILKMKKSLQDGRYIALVSSNPNYDFGIREHDDIEFLNDETMLIHRQSGNQTIINLNLIIGVCIVREWI